MTGQGQPPGARGGGETRPPASRRELDHPPGDRYAGHPPAGRGPSRGAEPRASGSPRLGRALGYGLATELGVAIAWSVAAGLLDVKWGLVVVAALGGWLVGSLVALGAWGETVHEPDVRVRTLAAVLAVATWLLGTFGGYLVGLAILPGSSASFAERLANAPFGEALVTQLSLFDVAEIVLLAVVAWRSAR